MGYHDHDWQLKDAPIRWRVAELYARLAIGMGWGFAMFVLFMALLGPESRHWVTVAFVALLLWGADKATPPERDRDD